MAKSDLRLAFCSHQAARFAIQRWYYRPEMPIGKLVKIGVWEKGQFAGVVIFSPGSSDKLGVRFGLANHEVCELARLALRPDHECQVSRVLRIAVKLLHDHAPGIRVVVTFADPVLHHGGVYQAAGWTYTGQSAQDVQFVHEPTGRVYHSRSIKERGWDRTIGGGIIHTPKRSECRKVKIPGKLRYALAVDPALKARVAELAEDPPTSAPAAAGE